MSNLGFQTIYWHLNELPDVVCERVFLPDPGDIPRVPADQHPALLAGVQAALSEFDLVGFSITYEGTTSTPSGSSGARESRAARAASARGSPSS